MTYTRGFFGDRLPVNLGYVYENIIAQMLTSNGHELYYNTFLNEASRHNYEIDFLYAEKNKINPIEVKSSSYKTHSSLEAFSKKYSSRIGRKILLYSKDYRKDGDIECMPFYLAFFLKKNESPFGLSVFFTLRRSTAAIRNHPEDPG